MPIILNLVFSLLFIWSYNYILPFLLSLVFFLPIFSFLLCSSPSSTRISHSFHITVSIFKSPGKKHFTNYAFMFCFYPIIALSKFPIETCFRTKLVVMEFALCHKQLHFAPIRGCMFWYRLNTDWSEISRLTQRLGTNRDS